MIAKPIGKAAKKNRLASDPRRLGAQWGGAKAAPIVIVGRMSERDRAAELAKLRDTLVALESGTSSGSDGADAPRYDEREIARVRARIAELEADLGI